MEANLNNTHKSIFVLITGGIARGYCVGVGPQHTDKYEKDMRDYYNKIYNESQNIVEEVPQFKDVLNPPKRKKGKKTNLSPVPESIQLSTPASI